MKGKSAPKWYQQNWAIILLLILFWPIGLYLMWQFANWDKAIKIALSIILGLLTLVIIANPATWETAQQDANSDTANQDGDATENSQTDIDAAARTIAAEAISLGETTDGPCLAEYQVNGDDYVNEGHIAREATKVFVASGRLVFADEQCSTFVLGFNATGKDAQGNEVSGTRARFATFNIDRDVFARYNWDSLEGHSVGEQLQADDVLRLPLNSNVDPEAFRY